MSFGLLTLACHAAVQAVRTASASRGLGIAGPSFALSSAAFGRSGRPRMMAPRQEVVTAQWEWRPVISWYPGHIARAEKQLVDMLKLVDVVIELRDSRIPRSTCHPLIEEWVGNRGHILVMNRFDSVPTSVVQDWTRHLAESNVEAHWVNAKEGKGIEELKRAIVRAGKGVNERRKAKGLLPRAVRACILGFPNVGKSALINRLIGRAKLKSENRAGVTRSFSWSAVGGARERSKTKGSAGGNEAELQLLDTPGIIPAKQVGQRSAYMLAVCDDIGAAAYDTRAVALTLIEELKEAKAGYVKAGALEARYGHGLAAQTAEDFLERVAEERCGGDLVRAETMVLRDFRDGRLGLVGLEAPIDERAAAGAKPRAAPQAIRRSPSAAAPAPAVVVEAPVAAGVAGHAVDADERP